VVIISLFGITYRKEVGGREIEQSLIDRGIRPVYALWHGRIFFLSYFFRWQRRFYTLVSPSIDGEIIAGILRLFGFRTIRGSSFKGGGRAYREMIRVVSEKGAVFITVDGSRGPAFKVQKGILHLAKLSNVPILPVTCGAKNAIVLKSWDRFIIPYPFTRVAVIYGGPVYVSRDSSEKETEEKRVELEKRLLEITERADTYFRKIKHQKSKIKM